MRPSSLHRGLPAGNPIANALVIVVGALAIGASIVLGFVAFLVLGAIVLVLGAIIGLRVWWFNRKLGRRMDVPEPSVRPVRPDVIEGEYHVVKDDKNS